MGEYKNLDESIEKALKLYKNCICCGHMCKIDRTASKIGRCRVYEDTNHIKVASHTLHFGEEPMLVGEGGSGTVFFSSCNLNCVFCQNYQISQESTGNIIDVEKLSSYFLDLQKEGASNINLVSATHVIYQVLKALKIAIEKGLVIPIVYNTNGYETLEMLDSLNGIVDIYLPDIKYVFEEKSKKYSNAENYFATAMKAIKEMKRQVGDIVLNDKGIAKKGLIIRHLILPENESDSYDVLIELKENGFTKTTVSLMSQYSPKYKAYDYEKINKPLTVKEYDSIVNYALELGFENLLIQDLNSKDNYIPDFSKDKPFK